MARFPFPWQSIRKPLNIIIIVFLMASISLIIIFILGHILKWDWTGLDQYESSSHLSTVVFQRGKTLWDWLQLLIIPIVLAGGGYVFNYTVNKNQEHATNLRTNIEREAIESRAKADREAQVDNQRETSLQLFIDRISILFIDQKLLLSQPEDEIRKVARIRTLTTLSRLDEERKRSVLQFLYESKLIEKDRCIVVMKEASFIKARLSVMNLSKSDLSEADLSEADLSEADLSEADLSECVLSKTKLQRANLKQAIINDANLSQADLSNADLSNAYLAKSILYKGYFSQAIFRGATMLETDLSKADLNGAILIGADLSRAKLIETDLKKASLKGANLSGANLSGANLSGAITTQEQLDQAESLKGTILSIKHL